MASRQSARVSAVDAAGRVRRGIRMPSADHACRGKGPPLAVCDKCGKPHETVSYEEEHKAKVCCWCWADTKPGTDLSR
jgi:hypothetical protein